MKAKRLLSLLLALVLCVGLVPSAFAIQDNAYHDPAEHWITALDRTDELDANAVVTQETFYCAECDMETTSTVWRTPEYTVDGVSAMTRNVIYSDGTMADGETKGTILDGAPGVDATYTGFHWTKSCCETCGIINSNSGKDAYDYGKNIYILYDCAAEFMEDLDETVTYEYTDDTYHTKTVTGGTYCCFCYGTHYEENSTLERHTMESAIRPEIANGRFVEMESCTLCDYAVTSYTGAKAVIANYYGTVDGQPHTVTVSDLSESGVTTQIRYGHSADSCTLTSAPNYTEAGSYPIYYEITYTYKDTDMTENGVAYVHLYDASTGDCACGCGNPDCACDGDCGGDCCSDDSCGDNHNWVLLNSVDASCLTLGYDRYVCVDCGRTEKRDYTAQLGHAYQSTVIRDATCETDGKVLEICERCGDVKETSTPKGEHEYMTYSVSATCTSPGYTVRECAICGDRHIEDITSALSHDYIAKVTAAICEAGGHTLHICEGCGSSFVTDYTDALGHSWDEGKEITGATCTGESVIEYTCTRCGATRLEGGDASGHVPGEAATCTTPQLCTNCGAVIENALGHDYEAVVTDPTCTEMGYTTYTCTRCGDSYKGDYTDAAGHQPGDWIIDVEPTTDSEGSKHKECEVCGETLETEEIEKIYNQSTTDEHGEAIVGGYLVTVTDTDTTNPVANATVTLHEDDTLSVLLPSGWLLDYADQTTVTVQLVEDKSPVADMFIAVTDRNDNYCEDTTDASGQITVPGTTGKTNEDGDATVGYEDGSFGPERNMTRAEASAIFARLLSDRLGERIPSGSGVKFEDVDPDAWYAGYVQYLTGYGIAVGFDDGLFHGDEAITRAEFVAMTVRFFAVYGDGNAEIMEQYAEFNDVSDGYWAAEYIQDAAVHGWIEGYGDGTFRPGVDISRAEVVTIVNRLLGREADEAYIDENINRLVTFHDMTEDHWAYYDVMESANAHTAYKDGSGEQWSK